LNIIVQNDFNIAMSDICYHI